MYFQMTGASLLGLYPSLGRGAQCPREFIP